MGSTEATYSRATGWRGAPSGPPQRPPCPALAGPDMGQLITTLTSGLCIGTPKISTFSGDMAPGKTEVSYEQWSHEVQCIKDPLPRVGGEGKHHKICQGGNGRYDSLHGPYCQCL